MKAWSSFCFIVLVMACDSTDMSLYPEALFPPGSEIEAYDNIPGLVRVRVRGDAGQIIAEGDFMNGVQHGMWAEYDPETRLVSSLQSYYMGKKQGVSMEFDRGRISVKSYYNDDKLDGLKLAYGVRGVVGEENYVQGVLHGEVRKYYPRGEIMEEAFYSNGVIDGLAKWYDQEGNLKFQYLYERGELVDDNPPTQ